MASFTLYYDMVVSGTVQIEAEDADYALIKMNQLPKAELIKGLDNSTADRIAGGFQLHDENGEQVF